MQRTDSLEKTLMLWKIEGRRRREQGWDGWMASPTQWTRVWASSRKWWRTGKPGMLQSMGHKESDTTKRLNNSNILGWGQMHLLPPDLPDDQGRVQWKLQPQCQVWFSCVLWFSHPIKIDQIFFLFLLILDISESDKPQVISMKWDFCRGLGLDEGKSPWN